MPQPSTPATDSASSGTHLQAFHSHRPMLFGVAYRMLGSVADAEDLLQETFIRWQQTPPDDVRSARALLVTIVTRLCLNHLESAKVRREHYYGEWLPEPIVTETADQAAALAIEVDESLSMAFLVLLERLTPAERAVLLLRDVFEYEYAEIAATLGQAPANCRQLLRRARQRVAEERPRFKPSQEKHEQLLREFVTVTSGGDLARLVALLSQDAVLYSDGGGKRAALPVRILGGAKVARALVRAGRKLVPRGLAIRSAFVNGRLGVVSYFEAQAYAVLTLDITDDKISAVYIISNPDKLTHLPPLGLKASA